MGIDPGALGELLEQGAIETARGAVVDVLDGGLMAQPAVTPIGPSAASAGTPPSSARPTTVADHMPSRARLSGPLNRHWPLSHSCWMGLACLIREGDDFRLADVV
jgi:hypothetical protein